MSTFTPNAVKMKSTSCTKIAIPVAICEDEGTSLPVPKFSWFCADADEAAAYKAFRRSYFALDTCLPLYGVVIAFETTRYNIFSAFYPGNHFFVPFVGLTTSMVFMVTFISYQVSKRFPMYFSPRLSSYLEHVIRDVFKDRVENIITVCSATAHALYLFYRSTAPPCPPNTSPWANQSCSDVALCHSLPSENLLIAYIAPLLVPTSLRGIDFEAALVAWSISVSAVIAATLKQQTWGSWSVVLLSFLFLEMIVEQERFIRLSFLQRRQYIEEAERKHSMERQKAAADLKHLEDQHRMDMLQVEVENERKLMEQERTSLCGLIGNIAHDLKTPLHSISMDLELLHSSSWLKRMTREAQNERSKLFEGRGSGGESTGEVILNGLLLGPSPRKAGCKGIVDPGSVLESMQSTISFMTMAINRCIDFTKASSGIALVPTLGTFALNEAIRSAVSCVESLQSDVAITVAPLPETMCPHIVADKQWTTENLLCLLSNAVKYSNGGTVDISVTITDGKPSNDCTSSCSASPLESSSAANTTAAVWPPEEEEERGFRNGGDGGSCNVPCTVVEEDVEEEHQDEREQGRNGPPAMIASDKANIRIGRGSSTPSSSPPYSKTKREKSAMPVSSLSVVVDEAICGGEAEEEADSFVSAPTSSSGTTSSKRPPRPPPTMIASEEEHEDCGVKFVRITVQDTGVLLPAEMKRKLFKPLRQAERLSGGTGLGLYSLYKRVEALGGCCGVDDRTDGIEGSIFWFAFPYRPDTTFSKYAKLTDDLQELEMIEKSTRSMRRRRVSEEMTPGSGASAAFAKLKRELFHASHGTSTDTADDAAATLAAASASVTATAPFPASGQVVGEEFKGGRVGLPSRWSDSLSSSASEIPSPSVTPAGNSSDAHSSTSTVPPNTPSPVYAEASGSLHILVVDDSMAILKVTRRVLEHAGHQVDTASNGKRALELLASQQVAMMAEGGGVVGGDGGVAIPAPFDLVLMDLQMPVMDGIEATKKLRAREIESSLVNQLAVQAKEQKDAGHHQHSRSARKEGAPTKKGKSSALQLSGTILSMSEVVDSLLDAKVAVVEEDEDGDDDHSRKESKREFGDVVLCSAASERDLNSSSTEDVSDGDSARRSTSASGDEARSDAISDYAHTLNIVTGLRQTRLPIIGMSANSDDASKQLAMAAGMDGFIAKPFTWKDLEPMVSRMSRSASSCSLFKF